MQSAVICSFIWLSTLPLICVIYMSAFFNFYIPDLWITGTRPSCPAVTFSVMSTWAGSPSSQRRHLHLTSPRQHHPQHLHQPARSRTSSVKVLVVHALATLLSAFLHSPVQISEMTTLRRKFNGDRVLDMQWSLVIAILLDKKKLSYPNYRNVQ